MPQAIRYINYGNPDAVSGGILLSKRVTQNKGDFDTATLSMLVASGEATAGITPGSSYPGEPGLICFSVDVEAIDGGSYRRTGHYKGFAGRSGGVGTINALTEENCRVTKGYYTREGAWNQGDGGFTALVIPGFPSGENGKPARFSMMVPSIRARWIASNEVEFPVTLGAAQSPPGTPPTPLWPYHDDMKRVRVYPNGWLLRSMSQERVAEGVDIFTGEAEWVYEFPYSL